MALVKFGQLTLNVENVPDGHMIVSEADYQNMKQAANALFTLKSKIPIGVDESQLGVLLEKGQKHDTIAQELVNTQKSVTGLTEKVNKFSNLPPDFSVEVWNKDRNIEKLNARNALLADVETKALTQIEKDYKIKPQIDKRFLPDLSGFDPTAKDAVDQYIKILDQGHTAQQEFLKSTIQKNFPAAESVGGGAHTFPDRQSAVPQDTVGEHGVVVGHL